MSDGKIDKLARMANQIGDFFGPMPETDATQGVATHLRRYWTPKMIAELIEAVKEDKVGLNKAAAHGLAALARETLG